MIDMVKNHVREKPVQSVERTLRILELMAERGQPLSLSDISNHLNLKISTAHRLLKTLIICGFAQQDPYSGKYLLGIKNFNIGNTALYSLDIRSVARPFLNQLVANYHETASIGILDQGDLIYIDQVESEKMVKMLARLGSRLPAHSHAMGKALLAALSDAELDTLLKNKKLVKFTENTITSPEQLKKELHIIRRQSYALDLEETEMGIRCVAATIYNHLGNATAAVGISAPSSRISASHLGELAAVIKQTAREISARLGFKAAH
ncbi:MAG: IclR family transcriptional regulator [Bacillota bacterium]